jgi:hypothetical protein
MDRHEIEKKKEKGKKGRKEKRRRGEGRWVQKS